MSPRRYQMDRRAENAEETRRRIVRATYELHCEKGIAATSVRDIAERADVAVGTVYHHFPTYDDVIEACGTYTLALTKPPSLDVLDGVDGAAARLRATVEAVFSFYRRFEGFERVRADRDKFARLDAFLSGEEDNRRALLAAAVQPRKLDRQSLAVAFALLDVSVYRALVDGGLSHGASVQRIAALIECCLLDANNDARRSPGTHASSRG